MEDLWAGLLQSMLLVKVLIEGCFGGKAFQNIRDTEALTGERRNAQAEAILEVTLPMIAYIVVHVRYALSSDPIFFSKDTRSDSQIFYESMLEFFELHKDDMRLQNILAWWTA
ncbi:hypothetical protein DXG01_014080 [Tephrocybe rancida]|nr:hypothetical protein DXG01_014080 [Tephrocybe rancida]